MVVSCSGTGLQPSWNSRTGCIISTFLSGFWGVGPICDAPTNFPAGACWLTDIICMRASCGLVSQLRKISSSSSIPVKKTQACANEIEFLLECKGSLFIPTAAEGLLEPSNAMAGILDWFGAWNLSNLLFCTIIFWFFCSLAQPFSGTVEVWLSAAEHRKQPTTGHLVTWWPGRLDRLSDSVSAADCWIQMQRCMKKENGAKTEARVKWLNQGRNDPG